MFRIVVIENVPEYDDILEHEHKRDILISDRERAWQIYKEEIFDCMALMQSNTTKTVVACVRNSKQHTELSFSDTGVQYSSTFDILIYDET